MGKAKSARPVAENEAYAMARSIRTSPRKLNEVCGLIRGRGAETALAELSFCKRKVADDVRKVLQSAIANAENNEGADVDRLCISEIMVDEGPTLKRFRARAKGRGVRILKRTSHIKVVVSER